MTSRCANTGETWSEWSERSRACVYAMGMRNLRIPVQPLKRTPRSGLPARKVEGRQVGGIRGLALGMLGALQMAVAQEAVTPASEERSHPEDQVMAYYDAIERTEAAGGAYASELVDLYYGLGKSLIESGELEEARDALHRTVIIARVNFGPNSVEQTNYLYSIADIESSIGNLEAAIDVIENIYLIHARHYGEDNPAMLPAVNQIYGWYASRYPLSSENVRAADFENVSYLAAHIARLTEAQYGLGDVRTALGYRSLGQLHFLAIHHLVENKTYPEPSLVMDFERIGGEELRERPLEHHFEAGEAAFARAVEAWDAIPEASAVERAEARAQLGDWFLALKAFRKAQDEYERAYSLLAHGSEPSSFANDYMGQPCEVRFLNATGSFVREFGASETGDELELSMTVSPTGQLSKIAIVSAPSDASEEGLQAIMDYLQNTRFRPAVVDGSVRTIEDTRWITTLPKSAQSGSPEGPAEERASDPLVAGNDAQS